MAESSDLILYMRLRELRQIHYGKPRRLTEQEENESDKIFKKLGIQDCADGQVFDDKIDKIIEQELK